MDRGLAGGDSSLKMIPTYIGVNKEAQTMAPVIVLDAGGSNLRVAVVHFDEERKPVVDYFTNHPMPGTYSEVDVDTFFDKIAEYVEPVLDRSDKIAFCFSYAAEPLANRDARAIELSKELRVRGLVGSVLGESLLKKLAARGFKGSKEILVLNDSAATLLGGKALYQNRPFDSFIGFILGTGTNTCYIESNARITKIGGTAGEGHMLINAETGGYGCFPASDFDLAFDKTLKNPGEYLYEKMVAGRYQGGLILGILKAAAEEGLFSPRFAQGIAAIDDLRSSEVDDFLYYAYGDNRLARCCAQQGESATADRVTLYALVDAVMERAARFVTVNLASIMLATGTGANPCRPVCITADGTTFYYSKLFRDKLTGYVKDFINGELHLYCDFVQVEKATLIGTAIAGLLN
jgi:hexokinase